MIKTFDDLEFGPHPKLPGTRAVMDFKNGYGVSVVSGAFFYSTPGLTYEVAVRRHGEINYETPITDDVLGHLTEGEVTETMKQVQELANVFN